MKRISEAFLLPALKVLLDAFPFVIRGFDSLNPYLKLHRTWFFPEVIVDAKGKQRKRYPYERMTTPYEKLKSLPKAERFLKPNVHLRTPECTGYASLDFLRLGRHDHSLRNRWSRAASK